jgi:hypothetical protein
MMLTLEASFLQEEANTIIAAAATRNLRLLIIVICFWII